MSEFDRGIKARQIAREIIADPLLLERIVWHVEFLKMEAEKCNVQSTRSATLRPESTLAL